MKLEIPTKQTEYCVNQLHKKKKKGKEEMNDQTNKHSSCVPKQNTNVSEIRLVPVEYSTVVSKQTKAPL